MSWVPGLVPDQAVKGVRPEEAYYFAVPTAPGPSWYRGMFSPTADNQGGFLGAGQNVVVIRLAHGVVTLQELPWVRAPPGEDVDNDTAPEAQALGSLGTAGNRGVILDLIGRGGVEHDEEHHALGRVPDTPEPVSVAPTGAE